MTIGWWVIMGIGLFFGLSVLVGLAVAAMLGRIGCEMSELFEYERWASTAGPRETDAGRLSRRKRLAV